MINRLELNLKKRNLISKLDVLHKYCDFMEEYITEMEPPLVSTLANKADEELFDYLMYLKSGEIEITSLELNFINRFLNYSFSLERMNKIKNSKQNNDDHTDPIVFNLSIILEMQLPENNGLEITTLICEIYLEIGTIFINLEDNVEEVMNRSMDKIKEYSDHFIEVIENKLKKER